MPPKTKYTREEIMSAALEMARENGLHSITARALGEKLGTSSRPIFTAFQNMEEVQQEVIRAARSLYNGYVQEGLSQSPPFKGTGMQYIRFAMEEPKLFQILFMSEQECISDISKVLPLIEENYQKILASVQDTYSLKTADAEKLYQHLWIYTHGIATLCATNMCHFSKDDIAEKITIVFKGVLKEIKAGEEND